MSSLITKQRAGRREKPAALYLVLWKHTNWLVIFQQYYLLSSDSSIIITLMVEGRDAEIVRF